MTFAFRVLRLLFSGFGLNLAFLAGFSALLWEVSAGWWLFWEMQPYPGGISDVGEIAGVTGRGERGWGSQLGMSAAPAEVGHGDHLDAQGGEED